MTETLTLERDDVTSIEASKMSLMPEGLLEGLEERQVRDLIAYLMNAGQVPLPDGQNDTNADGVTRSQR